MILYIIYILVAIIVAYVGIELFQYIHGALN